MSRFKAFILFLFVSFSVYAQEFNIYVKIEKAEDPVDLKLYHIKSAFEINTLIVDDYVKTKIDKENGLFRLTGAIEQNSHLYRLHINKNKTGYLNRSFSNVFLQIDKNDSICLKVSDNDRFANYYVGQDSINIELSKLFALQVKMTQSPEIDRDLNEEYNNLVFKSNNPETFFVGIADSLIKYEQNILGLMGQSLIRDKVYNDFSNHYFSQELIKLENQLNREAKDNSIKHYILVLVILIILSIAIVLVRYFYQKHLYISRFRSLSNRERAILNLLPGGKTNQEISNELYIELSTVKKHITNIFKKIRVSNRSEAISFLEKYKQFKNRHLFLFN